MLTIENIIQITQAQILQQRSPSQVIQHLLLDSRKLYNPSQTLFFAIAGEHHNGHRFIEELYHRGVRYFIVEDESFISQKLPQATMLKVGSTIQALQQIVAHHRQQFHYPVIGITGSNGKTMVKEWLARLLSKDYKIVKSPKSYNSQVGVPLSVWQMHARHNLGIFEAGISQQNEMQYLAQVIQPTIGLFTNLGTAHDEGFEHRGQKLQEKWQLFASCETVIYCSDHVTARDKAVRKLSNTQQTFTWGTNKRADVCILSKERQSTDQNTLVRFTYQHSTYPLLIPFTDEASLENVLHCLAVLLHLGLPVDTIQARISRLRPVSMRMELKRGVHNTYLIDDTYNNDLAGLKIALDFMSGQDANLQKVVILSDMLQSGMSPKVLYQAIADLLHSKGIDQLIGVGEKITQYQGVFKALDTTFVPDTQTLLQHTHFARLNNAIVLIKGARHFRFEQLVHQLQQKVHGTVLEINLDALVHNLNFYRNQLAPQTRLMAMVKAFAYGSGSAEIAHLLQFHRVDYLGVAYADEGVFLRENGITLPIMVLNPSEDTFDKLLQYDLEPELYNFKILNAFISYLKKHQQKCLVHLKIDTGMHRLGFSPEEVPGLLQTLCQPDSAQLSPLDYLSIASVFSHLAGADEEIHTNYSRQQIERFRQAAHTIEQRVGYSVIKHIVNSPGIVRFPEAHFDMVRLGIGLYGIEANHIAQNQLKAISRLKTTISQIKELQAGETIGYGRKGQAQKPTKTATIAIGYADGFSRSFSNGVGKVMIQGVTVPIIGNICMDMSMVDISGIEANEGDDVIIFDEELSISALAKSIGTIPYEILTNIGDRVKRIFYLE